MRPTFDRRLWILLYILLIQCIVITNQQNIIKSQNFHLQHQPHYSDAGARRDGQTVAASAPASAAVPSTGHSISTAHRVTSSESVAWRSVADNKLPVSQLAADEQQKQQTQQKCAKFNCVAVAKTNVGAHHYASTLSSSNAAHSLAGAALSSQATKSNYYNYNSQKQDEHLQQPFKLAGLRTRFDATGAPGLGRSEKLSALETPTNLQERHEGSNNKKTAARAQWSQLLKSQSKEHQRVHVAHKSQHKEVKRHRAPAADEFWRAHESAQKLRWAHETSAAIKRRLRRSTDAIILLPALNLDAAEQVDSMSAEILNDERVHVARRSISDSSSESAGVATASATTQVETSAQVATSSASTDVAVSTSAAVVSSSSSLSTSSLEDFSFSSPVVDTQPSVIYRNSTTNQLVADAAKPIQYVALKSKRARSAVSVSVPAEVLRKPKEPIIIIDDVEEFDSGTNSEHDLTAMATVDDKSEDYSHDEPIEPRMLPLRPVLPNPYEDEEMSVVYAEQHSEIRLMCEVDLDIASSTWYKNGQVVHAMDRTSRATDYRFIKEPNGALTITNVMLEDDGKWQCEAENSRRYTENARPVKLVVLDRPKPPYLLIDSRRLDAGNIFVPVKENSELNLACVSEGGNPKPTLTWEVLLSPGVDRHAQKVSAEVLELEEVKNDKDKNAYKINGGAKSEARLPAVYRAHHNARILCVMEHPTLKIRQNASLLLDVQYTPSFAISRTPGFGYPLREGIEVSLKCDVDSNPPSTPRWQKDDGDTPVPQTGDGFLNFTSIRHEHSGWYKCTSRHLNFQYSSIGYYLSVRYDSVDVTSEPDDQDISVAAASHNPNKGQLEVQLGGAVTLQCPQGSLGCWSHLDPVTARLRGLGHGLTTPTGQFSLKDVVYHDAGTYKCIGQSPTNKKKLEVLQTVGVTVKGSPTVVARNSTPVAYPGSPLHLAVEFCANPPAHAARWLHGDRVYTPGNQYGSTVLAYGVTDLPTPYCKEARLTYVSMHERVPRTFYFIVSSPGGVAEATFKVNFTMRYRAVSNTVDDEEEELSEPEEIHFPVFGAGAAARSARRQLDCAGALTCILTTFVLLLCNERAHSRRGWS
ncbi:uncharacterized protein LOC126757008 [Bactrocera neohumeralis]|uniref:uncharacterized protein LOC126757008 n=1 Tax=Bactrocera neohumeralis TaxID=98809 RepID=UPI00216591C4|nr:uncharacterized protein LOC126757008 [Bactrocera neohumeralis]